MALGGFCHHAHHVIYCFVSVSFPSTGSERVRWWVQGVRTCLGMQLARMNLPCAVAKFVSAFRLELTPEVCNSLCV